MQRRFDPDFPEMMDHPDPDPEELREGLVNLEKINRHFGCHRLLKMFLHGWLQPGRSYRLLDMATGYGDIPRMIIRWGRRHDISIRIDAIDLRKPTLDLAREASADYPEIDFIQADALTYEAPATYDLVLCTLALHHFSEADAVRLLRAASQLSHRHVLISDLERGRFSQAAIWLMTQFLYREPMTRHDARLSIERAFSFRELRDLAERAGWSAFVQRHFFPARQAVWLSEEQAAPALDLEIGPELA